MTATSTIPSTNRNSNNVRGKSTTSPATRGTTSSLGQQQQEQQQQPVQSQAASWGKQINPIESSERAPTSGSWASVASAPKPPDAATNDPSSTATAGNNDSWDMTAESWPAAPSSDNNYNNSNSWSSNKVSSWDDNQEPENYNTPHHVEEKPPISTESSFSTTASSAVPPAKTWASLLK